MQIFLIYLAVLIVSLLIAYFYHAPREYYGTIEAPRFADPWMARTETILNGGLLYRDVFTTTPPLTNLLLIPPSLVPIYVTELNPWATLSYMLYFSLFNLFGAYVLLKMGENRRDGFIAAVLFLVNPLTFGNTVLRRQDESILVFFVAVALFYVVKRKHIKGMVAIGVAALVKLSGAMVVPIAFLHSRDWRYLVIPGLVFFAGLSPFLILAGSDAIFWDFGTEHGQHPFQYHGVSLGRLYRDGFGTEIPLLVTSTLFVVVAGVVGLYVMWKRFGVLEDMAILASTVFIFSPKLHTGYFSILVMVLASLIKDRWSAALYMLFGVMAMTADFYKWPIENFQSAFWQMIIAFIFLVTLLYRVTKTSLQQKVEPSTS
ncbi:MAG: DUF2029 domain-containing protein [Chloroflexi bacterium]|nr:DUF2029 domain-containing protein [Chloroflexota bacterium]